MENQKIKFGQFFTKKNVWLKPHIVDFIKNTQCKVAYDPYAGNGDLLDVAKTLGLQTVGMDIDPSLPWKINDSLVFIPPVTQAVIITNPPYLAKHSASRKKLDLHQYFDASDYNDVYLIALDKMLQAQKNVVAIIPESFLNSHYRQKHLLSSVTILQENPFVDTDCPVCVACFDSIPKSFEQIKIYKDDMYINTLAQLERFRIEPLNDIPIIFNDKKGWLGLRAIDSTDDKTFIRFSYKEEIPYDFARKIKVSSRHITLINIAVPENKKRDFINLSNTFISQLRQDSADVLLTPFMGNTKQGIRRRRLDFRLARAILERSYKQIMGLKTYEQYQLF